jgi:RNA polymerase sigma-54 factor
MSQPRLTQTLAQQQIFSPQMQQALAMLQAPAMELSALVATELAANPVLEVEEAPPDREVPETSDADFDTKLDQLRQLHEDQRAFDAMERRGPRASRDDEERRQFLFDSLVEPDTLSSHLEQQLRFATQDPRLLQAGAEIIGNLDPDGFLRVPVDDIASGIQLTKETIEETLTLLQSFHPVGVAARDLRECLLIQLDRLGKSSTLEASIVSEHLDQLAHHRYDLISRALKTTTDAIRAAAAFIATLDPKPGRAFFPDEAQSIVHPEITIHQVNGVWTVTLDEEVVPRLRISSYYKDLLASHGDSAELRTYLKDKMRSGKALMNSIHQRQTTIQRIAEEIVRRQTDFFDIGVSSLKPLTLAQVAAEVGVHETTVSRAISGKYARTPHGVFELKFFFTPGYQTSTGETVSNKSIKDALQDIIAKEDRRKPYSDEDIIQIFKERGITLARRTIAKYRGELGILSSSLRRLRD